MMMTTIKIRKKDKYKLDLFEVLVVKISLGHQSCQLNIRRKSGKFIINTAPSIPAISSHNHHVSELVLGYLTRIPVKHMHTWCTIIHLSNFFDQKILFYSLCFPKKENSQNKHCQAQPWYCMFFAFFFNLNNAIHA